MNFKLQLIAGSLLLVCAPLCSGGRRAHLLPKLQPGQTFSYLIRFQSDKNVKTESKVVAPIAPNASQIVAHGLLRIEILDGQEPGRKSAIHARGQFLTLNSGVWLKGPHERKPDWDEQLENPHGKAIELT